MSWVLRPEEMEAATRAGGKAASLAVLQRAGLPVPEWFALAPEAFYDSFGREMRPALEAAHEGLALRAILERLSPSPDVGQELALALAGLCPGGEPVAVRSSALDEDGSRCSFAGQLESFLFVAPGEVPGRVAAVWRSGFSERVLAYRRERGMGDALRPPAVIIQRMVNAEVSGVAFGADPVSGRRGVAVVAAIYGLGTALVSGECDADTYQVDRQGCIVKRSIATKLRAQRADSAVATGLRTEEVPEEKALRPALADQQVRAVADLARQAGRRLGFPQDIEWAIERGRLYLLQSRPITSLIETAEPEGALALWDNSNIAESYGGVTTPLTFSFARSAYEQVYRQFCRLMGVPAVRVAAHHDTFHRLLGLIRGRIYYNLLSWYRMLALLPGFAANRRFMEQMMGVRQEIPPGVLQEVSRGRDRGRWLGRLALLKTVVGILAGYLLLPHRTRRFQAQLEHALAPRALELEELRADELAAHYRDLEQQLLSRWDAPLVNDFLAMIFYGALRRLGAKWCGDEAGATQNDLLCGRSGVISAQPAARMREMARVASEDPALADVLRHGELQAILAAIKHKPAFQVLYQDYLHRFADRCLDELKLECPTLRDDPLPLLRAVGQMAAGASASASSPHAPPDADRRQLAEERLKASFKGRPLRSAVFGWVLRNARARLRDRENLRYERTRLFGRVRRIFVEIGGRFHALGLLDDPRDIFYLEADEILGFIEGAATCTDLRGLAGLRRREFDRYLSMEPPADRFQTRGVVHHGNLFQRTSALSILQDGEGFPPSSDGSEAADGRAPRGSSGRPGEGSSLPVGTEAPEGGSRHGLGCCPGVVRGQVRVVRDPRSVTLGRGEILVAERTDPGWILLFPLAAGLVVERGSLLSHSAIVARELGLPTVVSLPGACRWLQDGDWVELDGGTGAVRRLERRTEDSNAAR